MCNSERSAADRSLAGPVSEEDFLQALQTLVREADSNAVDVRGGWDVDSLDAPDGGWDVEIVGLRR